MGSGNSVALDEHLGKWEAALSQLDHLNAKTRAVASQDRFAGAAVAAEGGIRMAGTADELLRRPSSSVSFGQANAATNVAGANETSIVIDAGSSAGASRRAGASPAGKSLEVALGSKTGFNYPVASGTNSAAGGEGSASGQPKHTRQQTLAIRRNRTELFKSYEETQPEVETDSGDVMQCSHFGAAAVALSYLLGGAKDCDDRRLRVTVEDIFFAAQVPLHMLHTGAPHLPVFADVLREFLDVDNRFKDEYGLEEVHLDVSPTVGQVELGPNEVGDRQTRMQLPEFRRLITKDCEEETQVIRIVNYDPYVLEQGLLVDAYEEEEDLNSPLAQSVRGHQGRPGRRYQPRNDGAYAVIVDVRNVVQPMVTIAVGVVSDALSVQLMEVPAAALFKAMMVAEEGHRARGFIKIFRKDSVAEFLSDEVAPMWTPELCSGKVLGSTLEGTQASAVSHHVSPDIVSVAWALHLLAGPRPGTHGYGKGLPISDIIRRMCFSSEVFMDGDMALEEVYSYAVEYLARSGRQEQVHLYPVLTKISREDAVPTISVFGLEAILTDVKNANNDPDAPKHVMVIMYNACVAHNVLYIVNKPQWCVFAGYDVESQTVLLIDAHPKTFSRTWTCPLDRLHKAMTGYGYLVFSGAGQKATKPNGTCIGAPPTLAPTVEKRLNLVQQQGGLAASAYAKMDASQTSSATLARLCSFPNLPLMPTMIAMITTKLGELTTLEDVVRVLPFEISSMMIRVFTLESFHVALSSFLHKRHVADHFIITSYHGETNEKGESALDLKTFQDLIEAATDPDAASSCALVVHMEPTRLLVHGVRHPFGSLGIVSAYDKVQQSVVVTDANPSGYLRTWAVPVTLLHDAIIDSEATMRQRRRGCLLVRKTAQAHRVHEFPAEYTRHYQLHTLPVQNLFHVSPSPHFQGMSLAFAQLGHFYSPEEIFYEAYLKTMNDQRRRGSQAYAWRDVDVSLSVINKHIDAGFMAQVCNLFLESRSQASQETRAATDAQEPELVEKSHVKVERLDDLDVDDELEELLKEATASSDVVLLLNYDVRRARNLPNMGSSVALVKSFDPANKKIELWDAEYTVFGLQYVVTMEELINIGDLENEGRSAFGFVKFTKSAGPMKPKKRGLMAAPKTLEEEADIEDGISSRRKGGHTTFVKRDQ